MFWGYFVKTKRNDCFFFRFTLFSYFYFSILEKACQVFLGNFLFFLERAMFLEKLLFLCRKKGITLNALAIETGQPRTTILNDSPNFACFSSVIVGGFGSNFKQRSCNASFLRIKRKKAPFSNPFTDCGRGFLFAEVLAFQKWLFVLLSQSEKTLDIFQVFLVDAHYFAINVHSCTHYSKEIRRDN